MASNTQIDHLVQAYIDGELTPSEQARFEKELQDSSSLRRAVKEQRETTALLFEAYGEARLKHDLRDGIMAHLPEINHERLVQEVNYRAKHPENPLRWMRYLIPALVPLVLIAIGFMLYASWPDPQAPTGKIIGVVAAKDGRFKRVVSEDKKLQNASLRSEVRVGQRYRTLEDSRAMFTLAGGTSIKLASESEITILGERHVEVHSGRIWLEVGKDGRLFQATLPTGKATVFGTVFQINVRNDDTLVTLQEGEVTVQNKNAFWDLEPNEQVALSQSHGPLLPRVVDTNILMSWAEGIAPDPQSQEIFSRIIPDAQKKVVSHAQPVWRCDTRNRPEPTAITFSWVSEQNLKGHCGYEVYVYDETMRPLFLLNAIPGAVLDAGNNKEGLKSFHVDIPETQSLVDRVVNIRLVPDYSAGHVHTTFTEVTAVGF